MIRSEIEGGLCLVWLARADKANALTGAMLEAIGDAVSQAASQGAKALVLCGEGKVFSAGADLEEMKAGLGTSPAWGQATDAIAAFPGLTIAALNGTLAGGAMGLALACDLRIAVPTANFFYPVMRLGYLPQPHDPGRLTALVGPSRARMILLAGARIAADEALAWGLIDRIVEPDSLIATAKSLAADALNADQSHVAALTRLTRGNA
ncbi:MAG TPA: enoyl-CoA hydratase/isomerase family protein [Tabrizicola sp.]|nr:enoyl-CoA hydratase/isomerase family protein [Tabrizicola sp.]